MTSAPPHPDSYLDQPLGVCGGPISPDFIRTSFSRTYLNPDWRNPNEKRRPNTPTHAGPHPSPHRRGLDIGAEGLDPKGTDQIITTTAIAFKVLPIAARHSNQLYLSGSLSELALGAVAIVYVVIAILVRKRGSTAATVAALIGGIGALCGVIVNVFVGINLAAAATAHVTVRIPLHDS